MLGTQRIALSRPQRRRLMRLARKTNDAAYRTRLMIVLHTAAGKGKMDIADALGCSVSTVDRTRRRWKLDGLDGLVDRRSTNGLPKVDDEYVQTLWEVLEGSPQDHGYDRPTWTQELMIAVLRDRTGITVSTSTMCRLLSGLGVRRGAAKPIVGCPWPKASKARRIRLIRRLVALLGPDEAAVWEDEVDVELNPKIGLDWMLPGTQRKVLTPGQNRKTYLAGALDATTGRLVWVRGSRKNSGLFLALLTRLNKEYVDKRVVHVILDNYCIHSSRQTKQWLAEHGGKFRLHFLPPYCPDDNRIERTIWREMHANVTRNHRCGDLEELYMQVSRWLRKRNRQAKRMHASELRKAI